MEAQPARISISEGVSVSALLSAPAHARAMLVLAHGAGAGMSHAFMEDVAEALAAHAIATLRFNFPFMERSGGAWTRTDPPAVAHAAIRAAVAHARSLAPGLPLFAGGKSFGARMTSQAEAEQPIDGVAGLVFLGFPLHPARKPSVARAGHLSRVTKPMLFVQGTRDALAELPLVRDVCAGHTLARLHLIEGADHGFDVLARSGLTRSSVLEELGASVANFIELERP